MRTLATLFFVATTSFAFHPTARAVNPPPDGGYPNRNTAEGTDALFSLNIDLGLDNTALGYDALYLNTNGYGNTGAGSYALYSNNGIYNTGLGFDALYNNTSGGYNTACGTGALFNNNTGHDNTAVGFNALIRVLAAPRISLSDQELFITIRLAVAILRSATPRSQTAKRRITTSLSGF